MNEALKGFAHVNKKAYEQYQSFTKQRDELIARQEELDESQNSILELIDVLDARKDEAIERTFKLRERSGLFKDDGTSTSSRKREKAE